tara:strand:- start:2024 stop:2647 length:624 start_codon:yes stop_codon:yes gene_type:complete
MKRMNKVMPTKLCVICQEEKFVMNVVQHSGCKEGVICKACIEKTPVTLLVNCPICRQKTDEFKSKKKTKIHPTTKRVRPTNTPINHNNEERELSPCDECLEIYREFCYKFIKKCFEVMITVLSFTIFVCMFGVIWAIILGIKFKSSSFPVIIGLGFVSMILAWLFTACCQAMADADSRHRRRVNMNMSRRHWERNLPTRLAYDDIPV